MSKRAKNEVQPPPPCCTWHWDGSQWTGFIATNCTQCTQPDDLPANTPEGDYPYGCVGLKRKAGHSIHVALGPKTKVTVENYIKRKKSH